MGNVSQKSSDIIVKDVFNPKFNSLYKDFDPYQIYNSKNHFKILTYNLLGDCYSKISWLNGAKFKYLSFEKRSKKIVNIFQLDL